MACGPHMCVIARAGQYRFPPCTLAHTHAHTQCIHTLSGSARSETACLSLARCDQLRAPRHKGRTAQLGQRVAFSFGARVRGGAAQVRSSEVVVHVVGATVLLRPW